MNSVSTKASVIYVVVSLLFFCSCQNKVGQENSPVTKLELDTSPDSLNKYSRIEEVKKRIVIEKLAAYNVVSITYKGSYVQHQDAFKKLQNYVYANYSATGNCIGFYPFDPDLVGNDKLIWSVALRVVPGPATGEHKMLDSKSPEDPFRVDADSSELQAPVKKLPQPNVPFTIELIPAISAVSLVTTVENAGLDGLALNALIDLLGYVQVGSTRTEYAMEDRNPMKVRIKISIPVASRKSGLRLL